jgi:hypothetical protein
MCDWMRSSTLEYFRLGIAGVNVVQAVADLNSGDKMKL